MFCIQQQNCCSETLQRQVVNQFLSHCGVCSCGSAAGDWNILQFTETCQTLVNINHRSPLRNTSSTILNITTQHSPLLYSVYHSLILLMQCSSRESRVRRLAIFDISWELRLYQTYLFHELNPVIKVWKFYRFSAKDEFIFSCSFFDYFYLIIIMRLCFNITHKIIVCILNSSDSKCSFHYDHHLNAVCFSPIQDINALN